MLSLGHFVVVNWSEQLAVMQVMELLFSFHLQCLCVHVCVGVKAKGGPGRIWERGTTGGNTARWWPEWRKHQVRAQWRDVYRCEPLLQTSAGSIYRQCCQFWGRNLFKIEVFSGRMLLNVLYTNTASYSEQSDSNRKCPTLSYSNGSLSLFVYSTKSCTLHNKIIGHYCASAQRVHIFLSQIYFMSCQEKK